MSDQDTFIAGLYPAAVKVSQETGMSKELILAQAAEETGWGKHVLAGTNNIFNIKASSDWHGQTKTFNVWEIENGKKVWKDQEFRVYGSVEEALRDRVKFLEQNPRYAKAGLFDEGTKGNVDKEAAALQKAGYATDPNYAKQLVAVANSPTMRQAIQHAQQNNPSQSVAHTTQVHHTRQHPAINGALKQHAHDAAVHDLQTNLAKLGYKDGHGQPLQSDGHFGLDTRHAVERFQHNHGLTVDGVAGTKTLDAIHHAQAKHVAPDLTDPKNPDHALYEEARTAVHKLDASMGRTSDLQSDQLAASLVVVAKREGMTAIDTVVLSEDGSHAFAVQGRPDSPLRQIAFVPTAEAVNTPLDKSSTAAQVVHPEPVQTPPPITAPVQSAPGMAR